MRVTIYQLTEAPLILEEVTNIFVDGEDVTIVNYEGRSTVNIGDCKKIELEASE